MAEQQRFVPTLYLDLHPRGRWYLCNAYNVAFEDGYYGPETPYARSLICLLVSAKLGFPGATIRLLGVDYA